MGFPYQPKSPVPTTGSGKIPTPNRGQPQTVTSQEDTSIETTVTSPFVEKPRWIFVLGVRFLAVGIPKMKTEASVSQAIHSNVQHELLPLNHTNLVRISIRILSCSYVSVVKLTH